VTLCHSRRWPSTLRERASAVANSQVSIKEQLRMVYTTAIYLSIEFNG